MDISDKFEFTRGYGGTYAFYHLKNAGVDEASFVVQIGDDVYVVRVERCAYPSEWIQCKDLRTAMAMCLLME